VSNIFAGTEPPAWLVKMTTGDPGGIGRIVGELVGSLASSANVAIDKATNKQAQGEDTNWIKELPSSLSQGFAEARLNAQNPLWRMQAQQAQLNMAQQGLAMQNQQSMIDSRKTALSMQQHDQEVLPQWLQDHPTYESRQDAEPPTLYTPNGQKMFRDVQLGDAANVKHKAIVEGIDAYSKSVSDLQKLNPMAAAPFAAQIGKVPTPQMQDQLAAALGKEQEKAGVAGQPKSMQMTLPDGTVVQGFMEPGPSGRSTFKPYVDPNQAAQKKAEAAEKRAEDSRKNTADREALIYARNRVERLEKLIDDPLNKGKVDSLTQQWLSARKYLNDLIRKSSEPEKKTTQTAPAPAKPAGNDPLGLGISQ
jgi:hypothetical protein